MRGGGCLAAAAFEVHHRDDLQMFPCPTVWHVATVAARAMVQLCSDLGNVAYRVDAAVAFGRLDVLGAQLTQIAFRNPKQLGRFGRAEVADGLFGLRWKNCAMMGLQLARQRGAVLLDQPLQLGRMIVSGLFLRHFSNIPLHPETAEKTAFSAKYRSYGFLSILGDWQGLLR